MKTRLFLIALAATASLAACGAEDDPSETSSSGPTQDAANRKAMLAFAGCMRENGVDMPDPQFNGGRVTQKMEAPKNPDQMRTAEKACSKYRARIKAPEMSDAERAQVKKGALENARCMRDHGIENFPDPTFDESGGARIRIGTGLDPESPRFQAAMKACEKYMDGPSTSSAGGGEK